MRQFYVYILSSRSGVLYVGVTNDIERRVAEHKQGLVPGFTYKYRVNRLVWCESFPTALQAIEAEKRIKGWTRAKKIALIETVNPEWRDLAGDDTPVTRDPATPRANRHPEPSAAKDPENQGDLNRRDASRSTAQHDGFR